MSKLQETQIVHKRLAASLSSQLQSFAVVQQQVGGAGIGFGSGTHEADDAMKDLYGDRKEYNQGSNAASKPSRKPPPPAPPPPPLLTQTSSPARSIYTP